MKQRIAFWLAQRLVVRDGEGQIQPPGAGPGFRQTAVDGSEVAMLARGDGFDLYLAGPREVHRFALSSRVAIRLGWWLVWWWLRFAWCGLRLWLWEWARRALVERA